MAVHNISVVLSRHSPTMQRCRAGDRASPRRRRTLPHTTARRVANEGGAPVKQLQHLGHRGAVAEVPEVALQRPQHLVPVAALLHHLRGGGGRRGLGGGEGKGLGTENEQKENISSHTQNVQKKATAHFDQKKGSFTSAAGLDFTWNFIILK